VRPDPEPTRRPQSQCPTEHRPLLRPRTDAARQVSRRRLSPDPPTMAGSHNCMSPARSACSTPSSNTPTRNRTDPSTLICRRMSLGGDRERPDTCPGTRGRTSLPARHVTLGRTVEDACPARRRSPSGAAGPHPIIAGGIFPDRLRVASRGVSGRAGVTRVARTGGRGDGNICGVRAAPRLARARVARRRKLRRILWGAMRQEPKREAISAAHVDGQSAQRTG
jgi:hypothetical protein